MKKARVFEPEVWKFHLPDQTPKENVAFVRDITDNGGEADAAITFVDVRSATDVKRRRLDPNMEHIRRKAISQSVGRPLFLPSANPPIELSSPSATALGKRKATARETDNQPKPILAEGMQVDATKPRHLRNPAEYRKFKGRGRYAQATTS